MTPKYSSPYPNILLSLLNIRGLENSIDPRLDQGNTTYVVIPTRNGRLFFVSLKQRGYSCVLNALVLTTDKDPCQKNPYGWDIDVHHHTPTNLLQQSTFQEWTKQVMRCEDAQKNPRYHKFLGERVDGDWDSPDHRNFAVAALALAALQVEKQGEDWSPLPPPFIARQGDQQRSNQPQTLRIAVPGTVVICRSGHYQRLPQSNKRLLSLVPKIYERVFRHARPVNKRTFRLKPHGMLQPIYGLHIDQRCRTRQDINIVPTSQIRQPRRNELGRRGSTVPKPSPDPERPGRSPAQRPEDISSIESYRRAIGNLNMWTGEPISPTVLVCLIQDYKHSPFPTLKHPDRSGTASRPHPQHLHSRLLAKENSEKVDRPPLQDSHAAHPSQSSNGTRASRWSWASRANSVTIPDVVIHHSVFEYYGKASYYVGISKAIVEAISRKLSTVGANPVFEDKRIVSDKDYWWTKTSLLPAEEDKEYIRVCEEDGDDYFASFQDYFNEYLTTSLANVTAALTKGGELWRAGNSLPSATSCIQSHRGARLRAFI
ncbi:uncharacterized protein KY384_003986 [Bacidia gigantensis]|uniref:uncharacterized protein n=1 Tax=Bacidia gigantensis TaxID=2732470 RepID=UPI001D05A8B9|nr:uncharacterized protein KY384_003986 [Bacidia gigantensis]KAG8532345.1 hypothetical protein KY384_003986 [Bacidia gigantensis]